MDKNHTFSAKAVEIAAVTSIVLGKFPQDFEGTCAYV